MPEADGHGWVYLKLYLLKRNNSNLPSPKFEWLQVAGGYKLNILSTVAPADQIQTQLLRTEAGGSLEPIQGH